MDKKNISKLEKRLLKHYKGLDIDYFPQIFDLICSLENGNATHYYDEVIFYTSHDSLMRAKRYTIEAYDKLQPYEKYISKDKKSLEKHNYQESYDEESYISCFFQICKSYHSECEKIRDKIMPKAPEPQQESVDIKTGVYGVLNGKEESASKVANDKTNNALPEKTFDSIIQYDDKEKLKKRLHFLIDDKGGAMVGAVMFKACQKGYISKAPSRKEFESEFKINGSWEAISKYMRVTNPNAGVKSSNVIIFEEK
ncbi:MAG: hypothetical protein LKG25_00785 [Prevotella sp.]|jgi:hypothetical protein|nr:hypothetical protein [Prevotella sp.]MCI1281112.1 hypothetical protein [Prevotella sp.]